MIESIKQTSTYKNLNLMKSSHHAYFLYSNDRLLNDNVALILAKSFVCKNNNACNNCSFCSQFNSNSHPDVTIIDKDSIKVEDANFIINKLNTTPISSDKKIIVILNADRMNETAQNKLLKSLEEPNPSTLFILTTTIMDKILPTILSRVNKMYVPKLSFDDKVVLSKELLAQHVDITKYLNSDLTLTEIFSLETNKDYSLTLNQIKVLFENLKSSADIPKAVNNLGNNIKKDIFFPTLQNLFLSCLKDKSSYFDLDLLNTIKSNYTVKAITKCLPLIENAYKMQMANVNFTYILDNLLFNILKEKYLCK
ncbi:MAG: hypothetical protein IKM43_03100 [Clostridia bacterium]|nr:hypothetical protein [Clostridia bacterium]